MGRGIYEMEVKISDKFYSINALHGYNGGNEMEFQIDSRKLRFSFSSVVPSQDRRWQAKELCQILLLIKN